MRAADENRLERAVCCGFGLRLAEARRRSGLGLLDLALRLGVGRHRLWQMERGARSARLFQLRLLSRELGVSIDWLLGVDEPAAEGVVKEEVRDDGGDEGGPAAAKG